MRGQAFAVAGAVMATALMTAPAAQAQNYSYHDQHVAQSQYCAQRKNGNTAAGAVFGGLAGAVLGSQAAARGHRTDGSVLGAVLGAATGAAIARSNTRCESVAQGSTDPYYGESYDPYAQQPYEEAGYYDDGELYGGPQRSGYDGANRGDCQMGQIITRDPYGREMRENVMMCRGRDGVWRPQN